MKRKQPPKPSSKDRGGKTHDPSAAKPKKQARSAATASRTNHAKAGDDNRPKTKTAEASASPARKTTNASKARPQRGEVSMADLSGTSTSSHADRKARRAARRLEAPLRPGYSRKGTRYFIQGPVPLDWLTRASTCGRKGLNVGLALWWLTGVKKKTTVTLTREALEHFRVTPTAAVRILRKMETLNLCQVETKRGRGPRVTLA